jgi:RsiW-degrading membrane proteinase PrsW (M82 family)
MAFSAVFSWTAVAFVQIPLQSYTGLALGEFWSEAVLMKWLLLAGIPQILLSGLVQEGAKMVPVVIWWWRNNRDVSPKMGMVVGAVAGAGLGVFEAVWAHNQVFASGWTWQLVEARGAIALLPFVERFFAVPLHIGVSALAGYGLARGRGWQFYLLSSFLHALTNYGVVLLRTGLLTTVQLEIYAAVIAVVITGVARWLRWRKEEDETQE